MTVEELFSTNGIKPPSFHPGRYYTTCPQCSEKRSNAGKREKCLGITIERDGKAFWGCNHCSWQGPEKGAAGNGADKPELTSYVYRDFDGTPRFRKLRNRPGREPRFWLEQSDGNGGWRKGTKGVDTSLVYRADEVAKAIADGRSIAIVEGEKDCDALWRLGFPATCNAHGASEFGKAPKWTAKHSAQLKGAADLVIFNDNDSSGYAHADAVCRLSLGIAARVRRLDLKDHWPDIPPKGDVSDWLGRGHSGEELAALIAGAPNYEGGAPDPEPEPPPGPGPRPDEGDAPIELRVGATEDNVNEIERRLLASTRKLYQRGGVIVCAGFTKMPTWDGETVIGQIIANRGDYALVEDVEAVAKFLGFNKKGKLVPCSPPMKLIHTLKEREHRLRFPVLVGIVNCPSIAANGELLDQPGYDSKTGILFDPLGVEFPRVPDCPSRQRAATALDRILRLLETFDFVGDDDKAVALSLFLTIIARRGLPFAPLHGFDAPVAGSGKSKLVDIASILATGHEAGVVALGETREEAEKRLSAILMRGDALIAIDNCELPLEGPLLNQALTQQQVELRILGLSKMVVARTSAMITATGNNLTVKGDLTRRAVIGRLDPKVERPELRCFAYDPIADVKERRGELVVAVLTILKAYHNAGRPNRPMPLQSFTDWSNTVRGALLWLGQGDPVRTMRRLRDTDPTLINLRAFLTAWHDQFGDEPMTSAAAVAKAEETVTFSGTGTDEHLRRHAHPLLRDALLLVAGRSGKIDTRILGAWLGKSADRVIDLGEDGKPDFVALVAGPLLHGNRRWQVVKKERREAGGSGGAGG